VEAFNPRTGQSTHTNSCYFTMVAKNDDGSLKAVPGLLIQNETELRRFCEGKMIREFSRKKHEIIKSDLQHLNKEMLIKLLEDENCKTIN